MVAVEAVNGVHDNSTFDAGDKEIVSVEATDHSFEGALQSGKKHGDGVQTWYDGRQYRGQFKNDLFEGEGVMLWPDGRRYQGQYSCDKKHGYGVMMWSGGRRYAGQWLEGKRHGVGTYTNAKGETGTGKWVADNPDCWFVAPQSQVPHPSAETSSLDQWPRSPVLGSSPSHPSKLNHTVQRVDTTTRPRAASADLMHRRSVKQLQIDCAAPHRTDTPKLPILLQSRRAMQPQGDVPILWKNSYESEEKIAGYSAHIRKVLSSSTCSEISSRTISETSIEAISEISVFQEPDLNLRPSLWSRPDARRMQDIECFLDSLKYNIFFDAHGCSDESLNAAVRSH
jgi:hypothetical protein